MAWDLNVITFLVVYIVQQEWKKKDIPIHKDKEIRVEWGIY